MSFPSSCFLALHIDLCNFSSFAFKLDFCFFLGCFLGPTGNLCNYDTLFSSPGCCDFYRQCSNNIEYEIPCPVDINGERLWFDKELQVRSLMRHLWCWQVVENFFIFSYAHIRTSSHVTYQLQRSPQQQCLNQPKL